jgi:3-oxoadipate enol-lactonase
MLLRLHVLGAMVLLLLRGAHRRRRPCGGISMAYFDLGPAARGSGRRGEAGRAAAAEPWMLLHGLGSVAATWGGVLPALARDCRLLVPELSALGGTRAPGGGLTVDQAAHALVRLIEEETGGRPVTLAGLSMGAWMAVRLATLRPDLVARLVLVDAAGYRDQDWGRIDGLVRVRDLEGVERLHGALFHRTPWFMRWSRGALLRAYTSPGVRHLLDSLGEADTYGDGDLAKLRMPVALVWGEHDGLFPLAVGRAMAAAIPGARLYVLSACGHAVHLECPGRLTEALQQVRRDLPLARR